jgi:hypothetical protein
LTPCIEGVTDNRVAGVRHVDANLVCATRNGTTTDQRCSQVSLFNVVKGAGGTALFDDRHLFAVAWVAIDRRVDNGVDLTRSSITHREVGLADRVLAKGDRQREVGAVGFGNHHDPGRVLVQSVNDAGAFDPSDPRQIMTVVEEGIDECA